MEALDIIVKRAKERGATIVRDIWEESDDFGKVRFATVQTVRYYFIIQFVLYFKYLPNHNSLVIQHILLSSEMAMLDFFSRDSGSQLPMIVY